MNSNLAGGIESTENSSWGVKISSRVRMERLRFHITVYLDAKLLNVPPTFLSLEWYSPSSITFICQKYNLGFHDFFFFICTDEDFHLLHFPADFSVSPDSRARGPCKFPLSYHFFQFETFPPSTSITTYFAYITISWQKLLRFIHSGHFIDMILIFLLVIDWF